MSTKEETLKVVNIDFRAFLSASAAVGVIKIREKFGLQQPAQPVKTTAENTTHIREHKLHGNHPFASISGLLENHPLRDEYLEALGITE